MSPSLDNAPNLGAPSPIFLLSPKPSETPDSSLKPDHRPYNRPRRSVRLPKVRIYLYLPHFSVNQVWGIEVPRLYRAVAFSGRFQVFGRDLYKCTIRAGLWDWRRHWRYRVSFNQCLGKKSTSKQPPLSWRTIQIQASTSIKAGKGRVGQLEREGRFFAGHRYFIPGGWKMWKERRERDHIEIASDERLN